MREAALLLRSRPLVIDAKKMAPDEDGAMSKLPEDVRAEEGRALARLGDGGWDPRVQAGLREGRFSDELVTAAADLVRAWAIPARLGGRRARRGAAGDLVPDLARRLAGRARPAVRAGARARARPPAAARDGQLGPAGRQRARRVPVAGDPPPGACLLVDDLRFSGWTLAMVAASSAAAAPAAVYPLALATAF